VTLCSSFCAFFFFIWLIYIFCWSVCASVVVLLSFFVPFLCSSKIIFGLVVRLHIFLVYFASFCASLKCSSYFCLSLCSQFVAFCISFVSLCSYFATICANFFCMWAVCISTVLFLLLTVFALCVCCCLVPVCAQYFV